MKSGWSSLLLCAALVTISRPANAQVSEENAAAAQALFETAMELIRTGNHVEACPKLAESRRLDPAPGTEFRLAECYERTGRLASAWTHFIAVADASKRSNQPAREKAARERAEALRVRLPKISIVVSEAASRVAGLEVKRDGVVTGQPTWNVALPVDPGAHTIEATAPGKRPFQESVKAVEGVTVEVTIPGLETAASPPAKLGSPPSSSASTTLPAARDPGEAGSGNARRVAIIASGVVGLVGVVVGSVFGSKAFSTWDEALSHCQDRDPNKCDSTATGLENDTKTAASVSTVAFIVGGTGLATAGFLWLTTPSSPPASSPAVQRSDLRFVPFIGSNGFGGGIRGTF